jgi:hypothetical protein
MITNDQGIMWCEHCDIQIHTGESGDRICPELARFKHCPDLGLTYLEKDKDKAIEKVKPTRTGKEIIKYKV